MRRPCFCGVGAIAVALAAAPTLARAQAFTPPDGVGAVTLAWQYVDNTGHRLSDGYFSPTGQSVTTSGLVEMEYGVTDRFTATLGIPYVFAKYTGKTPHVLRLPVDNCRCWNSAFADFSASVRYRFGDDAWAVTPVARFGQPSHRYADRGEAIVGRHLTEAQLGVSAGLRLTSVLPQLSLEGGYTYAFVEKVLDEISVNRSNVYAGVGYGVNRRLHLRAAWLWQHTHGGVRPGFGELNTPERRVAGDRIFKVRYMQVAGGLSFNAGPIDLFASYTKYVWGRDAHNGQAFGAGVTWYFGFPE